MATIGDTITAVSSVGCVLPIVGIFKASRKCPLNVAAAEVYTAISSARQVDDNSIPANDSAIPINANAGSGCNKDRPAVYVRFSAQRSFIPHCDNPFPPDDNPFPACDNFYRLIPLFFRTESLFLGANSLKFRLRNFNVRV